MGQFKLAGESAVPPSTISETWVCSKVACSVLFQTSLAVLLLFGVGFVDFVLCFCLILLGESMFASCELYPETMKSF